MSGEVDPVMAAIQAQAFAEARARAEAIETACEMALVGGVCGVLVDDNEGTVGPSMAVPYGEIHVIQRDLTRV